MIYEPLGLRVHFLDLKMMHVENPAACFSPSGPSGDAPRVKPKADKRLEPRSSEDDRKMDHFGQE